MWYQYKDKIKDYGEEAKNAGEITQDFTNRLNAENETVRNGVQEFIDSGVVFEEFAEQKEKAFKDDQESNRPRNYKQMAKGLVSSALSTIGNLAVDSLIGMGIGALVSGGAKLISSIVNYDDNLIAKGKQAKESIEIQSKAFHEQTETLTGLSKEYSNLASGISVVGGEIKNISLTDDEFQSFLNTSNSIAELAPSMVKTYDTQGNAILNLGTNTESVNKAIQDYNKLQRDNFHINVKEAVQDQYRGILSEAKQAKKSIKEYKSITDENNDTLKSLEDFKNNLGKDSGIKSISVQGENAGNVVSILEKSGLLGKYEVSADPSKENHTLFNLTDQLDEKTIKDIKHFTEAEIDALKTSNALAESQKKNVELAMKANWKSMIPNLQEYINTSNIFDEIGESDAALFKSGLNSILGNIDYASITENIEEAGGMANWIDTELIAPIVNSKGKVNTAWKNLFATEELKDESIGKWAAERDKYLEQISEATGQSKSDLAVLMGYATRDKNGKIHWNYTERIDDAASRLYGEDYTESERDEIGKFLNSLTESEFEVAMDLLINGDIQNLDQLKSMVSEQMATSAQKALDDELSLDSMIVKVSEAQAALSAYSAAMNETNSASGLTADTITALTSSFDSLVDSDVVKKNDLFNLFTQTASGVRLNEKELRKLSATQEEIIRQDLAKSVQAQYDAYNEVKNKVGEYQGAQEITQEIVDDAYSTWQKALQEQAIFEGVVSDRSKWFAGTTEAYANYDTALSKLASLKNLRKDTQGMEWIGTNEFRQGVDYFYSGSLDTSTGEEIAHVYDTLMPMVQDWYKVNEDGSRNVSGSISSFAEDIAALPSIIGNSMSSIDQENKKVTISAQEFADAYGLSGEALEDFVGLFEALDWEVNWTDPFEQLTGQGTIENPAERIFTDETTKAAYDNIVSGIQDADEATKGLVDSLSQYTSEELRAINYTDGLYDTTAPEGAEQAVDNLRKTLGLSADQTHLLLTALEAMGVIDLPTEKVKEYNEAVKNASIEKPAERDFGGDTVAAENYAATTEAIQKANKEGSAALKESLNVLKGFSYEELSGIDFFDGILATGDLGTAEQSLDGLIKSLGLSKDQASQLINVLSDMGLLKIDPEVDTTGLDQSQKAIEKNKQDLIELQKQGKISSDISLNFDVETMSIDEIDSKINELNQEKIRLETEGDTSGVETVQTAIDALEKNKNISLKIQAQVDKGTSYEDLLKMSKEELIKTLKIDSSQVDEARAKLEALSQVTTEAPVTVKIDEAQLDTLTESSKNITVTANAVGKEEVDALQSSVDQVHGKVVPVKANVFGTDEVNELSDAINNVNGKIVSVGANVYGTDSVYGLASAINSVHSKTVTVTTNYVSTSTKMSGSNASGTMLSPAHSSGTAYNVLNTAPISSAHSSGKVALEKDEEAVVNELGTESIIRDGIWQLIPGKMHKEHLKKGDIILNAKQTSDLLSHGKTDSHARAYASGTIPNSKILSKAYAEGSVTDEVDKLVDWFERLVDKLEKRVDLYEKKSDNSVGLSSQIRYLDKAYKTNEELLKHYKEAQKKYKSQASSVAKDLGLSDSLRKKVENGSVNFEKLSEDDKKRVDAYQKWYEKINDCTAAIEDLKAAQNDLVNKRLDKVVEKYDTFLGTYKGNVDVLEAQKEYRKAAGYSEAPHSDYYDFVKQQINLQNKQTAIIESEIEAYKKQLSKIKDKKSPEYKKGIAQLKEIEVTLWESKTAAIEYRNEMYELQLQMKEWQVDKFNRAFDKQTARLDYLKATNYKDASGATEKDISEIILTNDRRVRALEDKRNEISKMMLAYGTNSTKYRELAEQLAECDEEILNIAADTAQWRKEILALRFEPFYEAQDALDEVIQDYEVIRSMMNSESFFNDDGSFTEYGMANITLLQESTEAEKQKIANYKKQLENIQKLYDNGSMTKEDYETYTKEILNGIRTSSQALSNYNEEILDMYRQQITQENELLQENINKRLEALNAKESYYEYDKTLKKKSKDINALKAQIAALEGTSNAAAKARLEGLKAELAEAETDMQDTVHNHEVEMQKYGYDKLSQEADNALENTLDALVKNTDMQKAVIDNMLSQVTASYEGAYGKIQDIIKQTGLMVSDAFKDYINSVPDFNTGNPGDYEADEDIGNMDTSQIPGHSQSGQGVIDGADDRNDTGNDASQTHPGGQKYDIQLDKTSVSVEVGKSVTVKASLVPKPAHSQTITWKSEKTSIATVSGGKITGKARGTTKVKASADYVYANATCTVKVLPKNYSNNVKGLNSYLSSAGQTLSDSEKEKIIYDSFGESGKYTSAGAKKANEAAKKILLKRWYGELRDREKGKPIPSNTSNLARHFMEKNKSVNRYELYELAKILGVSTPPADQYGSWPGTVKNKILSEVKKYGYAKGGIVDYGRYIPINTLDDLARSNGEWGMVAARRKELILNENLSQLLQTGLPTAVDIIRKFNIDNNSGAGSPRVYNDNTVYEVNIYVDKISNDTDIKKLAKAVDAELTKAHVKDMRKLMG